MAKITVPAINVNDEIKIDEFNDFINSCNAVTGNINAENVRDEGIDRRNIALEAVQVTANTNTYRHQSNAEHEVPQGVIYGIVESTTAGYAEIGNIPCDTGDKIFVSCSFSFFCESNRLLAKYNLAAGPGGYEMGFKLQFADTSGSGTYNDLPGTTRKFNNLLILHSVSGIGDQHADLRGSITITGLVDTSTITPTGTNTHQIKVRLVGFSSRSNDSTVLDADGKVESISMHGRVIKV